MSLAGGGLLEITPSPTAIMDSVLEATQSVATEVASNSPSWLWWLFWAILTVLVVVAGIYLFKNQEKKPK